MVVFKDKVCRLIILPVVFFWGCKEPFTPPRTAATAHYLVVEGAINAGGLPTTFTLSRTRSIRDTGYEAAGGLVPTIYESGAQVAVEDDQGQHYDLREQGDGRYGGIPLPIDEQRKYRLHITTTGKEYVSSFVPVISAPAVDSVYWQAQNDGVHVYFDAYNPEDATRYYRWTYEETWEIHTRIITEFKYNAKDTTVVRRTPEDGEVHICWNSRQSTDILVGNTVKLKNNSLSKAALAFVPLHDEALSVLYSLDVKVFALSEEEFEFWLRMKENTEQMGTIFSPQPSLLSGNIQCLTDPAEPVIGYISARAATERRIFIRNDQLPSGWNRPPDCKMFNVPAIKDTMAYYMGGGAFVPVVEKREQGVVTGYDVVNRPCADCRVRGVTEKPPFWP